MVDYERARKIMMKEAKDHSRYSVNRMAQQVRDVEKSYGKKAAKELMKETMSVRKAKYGSQATD